MDMRETFLCPLKIHLPKELFEIANGDRVTLGPCTGLYLPAWVAWAGLIKSHQLSLPCSSFGQILVLLSKYFGSVGNVPKNQHVSMASRLAT